MFAIGILVQLSNESCAADDESVNCEGSAIFDADNLECNLDKRNELSWFKLDVEDKLLVHKVIFRGEGQKMYYIFC